MSNRQQEAWGGEVRMPRWLRRLLGRPEPLGTLQKPPTKSKNLNLGHRSVRTPIEQQSA